MQNPEIKTPLEDLRKDFEEKVRAGSALTISINNLLKSEIPGNEIERNVKQDSWLKSQGATEEEVKAFDNITHQSAVFSLNLDSHSSEQFETYTEELNKTLALLKNLAKKLGIDPETTISKNEKQVNEEVSEVLEQ
jgi:NTP pyrophosphatase (non-canonical NTP hydrolase)